MKRNIKNEPFAWTNKSSWELIETLPFKKQMSCKMIYVALSIASKKQQNTSLIEVYKFDIARYGSMSEKTVQRYLPELENLGLIKVEPQDRESNGKFKKCRIWLYDSILSAGHMRDSCETDERQMEDTESDIYKQKNKQTKEIKDIVDFLNLETDSKYKSSSSKTQTLIRARLNDGFSVEDFKTVISKKTKEWIGTEQSKYLRPETLFGTKFEGYLNQKTIVEKTNQLLQTPQRKPKIILTP